MSKWIKALKVAFSEFILGYSEKNQDLMGYSEKKQDLLTGELVIGESKACKEKPLRREGTETQRIPCKNCGAMILPTTAQKLLGFCRPCSNLPENRARIAQVAAFNLDPELEKCVKELLLIDQTEGLMGKKIEDVVPSQPYDSNWRHIRGREIGQILCNDKGWEAMVKVAEAYYARGGERWRLDFCWHEITHKDGYVAWLA